MLVKELQFRFSVLPGIPGVTREIHGVKKILLGAGDGGYSRANVVPLIIAGAVICLACEHIGSHHYYLIYVK